MKFRLCMSDIFQGCKQCLKKMLVGKDKNRKKYLHFHYRTKAVDHIGIYGDLNYWLLTCRIELQ